MIGGVRLSWQTAIADLALILFMVTAAAMGSREDDPIANPLPARAEPLAIFRASAGATELGPWLDKQPRDRRQRLTIVAYYAPSDLDATLRAALDLAADAESAGQAPRLVLQPSEKSDILAVLAFDRGEGWHGHCRAPETKGAARASAKDLPCE